MHELFQSQVALAPGAVALVEGKRILTYGELNARANQLAHHLLELRVGPDVLVGLSAVLIHLDTTLRGAARRDRQL